MKDQLVKLWKDLTPMEEIVAMTNLNEKVVYRVLKDRNISTNGGKK